VPWYALPTVIIGSLLAIPIVGVLQALNDKTLSEKGFIKVILESYKHLPLLKGDKPPKNKNGDET